MNLSARILVKDGRKNKILIVFLSGLGNIILFRPALKALKHSLPDAEIEMLVKQPIAETILKPDNCINRFHYWPESATERMRLFLKLKQRNYSTVLTTFEAQGWKLAVFARMLNSPMRIGYHTGNWFDSLYTRLLDYESGSHEVSRHLKLLEPFNMRPPERIDINLPIDDTKFAHLTGYGGAICIHAGSSDRLAKKRWPLQKFIETAKRLGSLHGAKIIFLGGRNEMPMAEAIKNTKDLNAAVLIGELDIWETAFILKKSRLMISNDSGLMHLACAAGAPVLAIFGPTDIQKNRPHGPNIAIVSAGMACSPCGIRSDNCDAECLTGVSVERVAEAAASLMLSSG